MNGSGAFSLSFCSFGMRKIDRFKTGTQMALKTQCSTQPLRGKVSSWAISVIMAAHVLGGLDKQWLWRQMVRHVGSMDNGDQRSRVKTHTYQS